MTSSAYAQHAASLQRYAGGRSLNAVYGNGGLDKSEKAVLLCIGSYCNYASEDFTAFVKPGRRSLVFRTGLSQSTIYRKLRSLRSKGYIRVEHHRHPNGAWDDSLYALTPKVFDDYVAHEARSIDAALEARGPQCKILPIRPDVSEDVSEPPDPTDADVPYFDESQSDDCVYLTIAHSEDSILHHETTSIPKVLPKEKSKTPSPVVPSNTVISINARARDPADKVTTESGKGVFIKDRDQEDGWNLWRSNAELRKIVRTIYDPCFRLPKSQRVESGPFKDVAIAATVILERCGMDAVRKVGSALIHERYEVTRKPLTLDRLLILIDKLLPDGAPQHKPQLE